MFSTLETIGIIAVAIIVWTIGAVAINWVLEKFARAAVTGGALFIWTAAVTAVATRFATLGTAMFAS